jgi:RNA polymerase sigma-70 factor (ECF subfamily)
MKLLLGGLHPRQRQESEDPLAELVEPALAGDQATMTRLLRALAPAVLGVVRAVVGADHPDVPDLTQESLLAIQGALHAFRGDSSVAHYGRQIALRVAVSAQRRSLRRRNLDRQARFLEPPPTTVVDLEDPALRGKRVAAFRTLLAELPGPQAETLAMRVVLGYSLAQVAHETRAPINTVRSRIRLAIESLRRRVDRDPALREILGGGA